MNRLVEEIYAGSSVLGPKAYIPSTVKTKMNLLASFFGQIGMPWENEDFYNFALWVFLNFNGQIQVQYNSFCTRYRVCGQCFLVCNQNQVLVSRTETKVPFQYRCWSRNFFFLKLKLFYQFFLFNFFNFFQIFKTIQRILNYLVLSELFHIWQQIWILGPFWWKKIPDATGN